MPKARRSKAAHHKQSRDRKTKVLALIKAACRLLESEGVASEEDGKAKRLACVGGLIISEVRPARIQDRCRVLEVFSNGDRCLKVHWTGEGKLRTDTFKDGGWSGRLLNIAQSVNDKTALRSARPKMKRREKTVAPVVHNPPTPTWPYGGAI